MTVAAEEPADEESRDDPVDEDDPYDPHRREIEPGRPRLENVLFVILGAVGTIAAFLRGLGLL